MENPAVMTALGSLFNLDNAAWAALLLLLSAMLWNRCPDARSILRNTLFFIVFCSIGQSLTDPSGPAMGGTNAAIAHAIFVLCLGAAVIRLLGLFIFRILLAILHIHPPSILEQILVVIAYFIWAMLDLHANGVPLGEIITTSAIATAVLAFAMQDTLGNILGGLALQWDHSLKVGDWVRVGETEGRIIDIKWRAIVIETRGWETVILPNSLMMANKLTILGERTGQPIRWRRSIHFNVNYSSHPDLIISLAEHAVRDAQVFNVAADPLPNCVLKDISGGTAEYSLRFWLLDPAMDVPAASAVRQHVYEALNRHQIRLAMPKQHLYLTNKDDTYIERKQRDELSHRMKAVSGLDLFASFTEKELRRLSACLEYRPYAQGDVIFHQGDLDYRLYIIVSGEVSVYATGDDGNENLAVTLHSGDIFGEIGAMTGEPRKATTRAVTAAECYALEKQDFADILLARDGMIEEISEVVASRQSKLELARYNATSGSERPEHHTIKDLVAKMRSHFLDSQD